ncbi:hypothetical protein Scep_000448 [Stephania cephalantha]|uniref:V-ATPase proteolipid subunit C-like domain-containing protein n=1 Tax=Stephania cephalantha TaxID=152367 RepID=A0AAP0L7M2_9MAGN
MGGGACPSRLCGPSAQLERPRGGDPIEGKVASATLPTRSVGVGHHGSVPPPPKFDDSKRSGTASPLLRANAQQPKLFVGMILILIFAEALALYGLIVGIILSSRAGQSRAD